MNQHAPETIAPSVVEKLVAATGGNPLALIEIPAILSAEQLSGDTPLEDPIPTGPGLERAFRQHLEEVPEPTRQALLVAAAGEDSDLETIARAS